MNCRHNNDVILPSAWNKIYMRPGTIYKIYNVENHEREYFFFSKVHGILHRRIGINKTEGNFSLGFFWL